MKRKKMSNAILDANGGIDSQRALNTAHQILLNHDLRQPILYHVVLTGSQDITTYQKVIKSLIRRLRSRCRTEYFGAYEMEAEKGKGLHAHLFILIETSKDTPFKIMNVNDGEYLHKLALRHKLQDKDGTPKRIHVSKPKNRMHGGEFFARPVGEEKLADCLKWCSYEYKKRSKEGIQSRETYFNSEFKSNTAKRAAERIEKGYVAPVPSAASPAAKEQSISLDSEKSIIDQLVKKSEAVTKGGEMNAADKYIASKYEKAVGKQLNVEDIRLYLLSHGIRRTPAQVEFDLDERYGFYGYATSHPAPRRLTYAEVDAQLEHPSNIDRHPSRTDRHPSNSDRVSPFRPIGRPMGRGQTNTNRQGTI